MTDPERRLHGDNLGREDSEVRAAIRFALIGTITGVVVLLIAAFWVSGCGDGTDSAMCGNPQRIALGLAAPVILAVCGVTAFWRTYKVWRAEGTWWGWQGAGWFLMMVMLLTLTMGFPAMAGSALVPE